MLGLQAAKWLFQPLGLESKCRSIGSLTWHFWRKHSLRLVRFLSMKCAEAIPVLEASTYWDLMGIGILDWRVLGSAGDHYLATETVKSASMYQPQGSNKLMAWWNWMKSLDWFWIWWWLLLWLYMIVIFDFYHHHYYCDHVDVAVIPPMVLFLRLPWKKTSCFPNLPTSDIQWWL